MPDYKIKRNFARIYTYKKITKMKRISQWMMAMTIVVCGMSIVSCSKKITVEKTVMGVLEEPLATGNAPEAVKATMARTFDGDCYEALLQDEEHGVSVWSLIKCDNDSSCEGYGILVKNKDAVTILPDIRHGRQPKAHYMSDSHELILIGADMEGTGINVERPYLIHFLEDGTAYVVTSIDPYAMQQTFFNQLSYSIEGEEVSFYINHKVSGKATNHVTNMGGFDEDAIWIGEQLEYDFQNDKIMVFVTPGVKFVTGLVLTYDDMPTITGAVKIETDGSFALSDLSIEPLEDEEKE